jgi:hypothetical protein
MTGAVVLQDEPLILNDWRMESAAAKSPGMGRNSRRTGAGADPSCCDDRFRQQQGA